MSSDMLHLLVVRFRAQVDQVGRDAGQETLAVSATRAMICLYKVFVQFVDRRLKGLSVELEGDKREWIKISPCQGSATRLTLFSSSGGNLVWNFTDVPSL